MGKAIVFILIAIGANVHVLNEPRKGKGNAMQCLFRGVDADYYIMVDADHTYEAEVALHPIPATTSAKSS